MCLYATPKERERRLGDDDGGGEEEIEVKIKNQNQSECMNGDGSSDGVVRMSRVGRG